MKLDFNGAFTETFTEISGFHLYRHPKNDLINVFYSIFLDYFSHYHKKNKPILER